MDIDIEVGGIDSGCSYKFIRGFLELKADLLINSLYS